MLKDGFEIIEFSVSDKFCNDGVVAVLLIKNRGEILEMHDFLISCRVFGRKIENAIVDYVHQFALKKLCRDLIINFKDTESNKSSTNFLSSITINNKFIFELLDINQNLKVQK